MLPIRRRLYQSLAGFTPRQLFAALQGAWLEPTPGYIWQENTGVTPTTTGGQTIGRVADLSGWGNNATQATAANRPTYQLDSNGLPLARHDTTDSLTVSLPSINVRRNLLTYSEDFTNAAWDKITCTVTSNTHLNPWGEPKASTLSFSVASANGIKRVGFSCSDTVYAVTHWIKSGTATTVGLYARDKNNNVVTSEINVSTGVVSLNSHDVTVTAAGNGFWRISSLHRSNSGTLNVYIGPQTIGTLIFAASQYELGSTATPYQKVTDWTSEAYSSNGSVYFATPVGMSQLNNQSMGTTFTLPALSTDIYSWIVVPQRLSAVQESRLSRYMDRKAGIAGPDYFEQVDYGPELGGSFTLGAGWTFTGGVLTSDGTQGGVTSNARTVASAVIGTTYIISYTRNQASGLIQVRCGDTFITTHGAGSGTSTWIAKAGATSGALTFTSTNPSAVASISNLSVRELKDGMTGQLLDDNYEPLLMG